MSVMKDLYYTQQHEWVKIEGDIATIGISDHAQELLGEITYVELPETGFEVESGGEVAVVESTKAASDVYAPISGSVTEVNEDLESEPDKINASCYEEGWLCKLKVSDPSEVEKLMTAEKYEEYLQTVD